MRRLHAAILVFCALGALTEANAQDYIATPLIGTAAGLNNSGQVVGVANGSVYETGSNGQGLNSIEPNSGFVLSGAIVNDAGQVVGTVNTPAGNLAFISGPDGQGPATLIGTAGSDHMYESSAVNTSGQVVVLAFPSEGGAPTPYITGPDGQGLTPILLPTGVSSTGGTVSINDSGQVVGAARTDGGQQGLFVTQSNGQNAQFFANGEQPMAINATGQVVGATYGSGLAFVTGANDQGITTIGALAAGTHSVAWDINDQGVVVGTSTLSNSLGLAGFVYGLNGQGLIDLNSLVSLPNGASVNEALAINNKDQILVFGSDLNYYLLSPVPEPNSLVLSLGSMGLLIIRRATSRRKST